MKFAIICLVAYAAGLVLVVIKMLRAPKDTDLWGPDAALFDCNPAARAEILRRHPELLAPRPAATQVESGQVLAEPQPQPESESIDEAADITSEAMQEAEA